MNKHYTTDYITKEKHCIYFKIIILYFKYYTAMFLSRIYPKKHTFNIPYVTLIRINAAVKAIQATTLAGVTAV